MELIRITGGRWAGVRSLFTPAGLTTGLTTGLTVGLVAAGLLATGCVVRIDGSSEEMVAESFEIDAFTELKLGGAFEVELEVGPEPSLEVELPESLVDDLEVDSSGGRLVVRVDRGWSSTEGPVVLRVTTPVVEIIDLEGATRVDLVGLDGGSLDLALEGASQVTASGSLDRLVIEASGASRVKFDQVSVEEVEIEVDGSSSVELERAAKVTGSVSGASSVDVSDDATLDVSTSGVASVD